MSYFMTIICRNFDLAETDEDYFSKKTGIPYVLDRN